MNAQDYDPPPEVTPAGVSPEGNGLYCFLDKDRPCSSDCMSFIQEPVESPLLSHQQRNCAVLVSVERVGRYLSGVASALHKVQQQTAKEAADRVRSAVVPPPNPRGNV